MSRQKKNLNVELNQKEELSMTPTIRETDSLQTELDLIRVELEKAKLELEEKKAEAKKVMPLREVDEEEMIIIKKHKNNETSRSASKEKIAKQKKYNNQKVTGKFINRRSPGNPAKLTYLKYEDDDVKWWNLEDGKTYTIPRGFADQINEHYYRPAFIQKNPNEFMDPNRPQSAISDVDTSNKIYSFVPVNF